MFKIEDGRTSFYQWDLDRRLIVDDPAITQVHFCNRTDDCSLVCETYKENGLVLVNVPNILLQDTWRINVYAYDTAYTKFSKQFDVNRRSKPESYVYTETETLNFNTLLNRIDEVDENIAASVEEYLTNNPPQVDLNDYYNKEEVDNAIEAIELTPGPQGVPGPKGNDGYTPVKGVDYFDGEDGPAGEDGYTPIKGIDYFDGAPGKDGKDGKDYVLTEADKQEIAGMVEVTGGGGGGDCPVKAGTGANSVMTLNAASAGDGAIALGQNSSASSKYAVAIGRGASTGSVGQVVIGQFNVIDDIYPFIVGSGTDPNYKRNAMTVDRNNQVHFPGTVVVGENKDEIATKEYVDEAIGNIEIPEGGGGGGGEGTAKTEVFYLDFDKTSTTATNNNMKAFYDACMAGEKVSAYIKVVGTSSSGEYVPASITKGTDYLFLTQTVDVKSLKDLLEGYAYVKRIQLTRDNYSTFSSYAFEIPKSGSWTVTWDASDSNLYYAKEVLVYFSDPSGGGNVVTSYVALEDGLYSHTYINYGIPHCDYAESWFYDGSSINVSSGYSFHSVAYKL